jgi:hypothetical protein
MTEDELNIELNSTTPQIARARWLRLHIQSLAASLTQIVDTESPPYNRYGDLLKKDIDAAKTELTNIEKIRQRHLSLVKELQSLTSEQMNAEQLVSQRVTAISKMMGIDAGLAECKRALIATDRLVENHTGQEQITVALQAALDGLSTAVENFLPNTPTRQSTSDWATMLHTTASASEPIVKTRLALVALQVSDVMLTLEKRRDSVDGQLHAIERRFRT